MVKVIDAKSFASKVASLLTRNLTRDDILRQSFRPCKVAVCVSGGSDSMALAYLLKQVPQPAMAGSPAFDPICFIVDHGARSESRDEALKVQDNLSRLNLESRILQMHWPTGVIPSRLHSFESIARRKRYRLIASSAIEENIRHIFAGHHLDDQIETLLMRLMQSGSKSLLGLQGIAEKSPVPCCEDIFEARSTLQLRNSTNIESQTVSDIDSFDAIQIHRPLLDFSKEQITATCKHYGIPYVTDQTNFDPTVTTRNSIRHLRTQHSLPVALNTERLLSVRQAALDHRRFLEEEGQRRLAQVICQRFDERTGLLELETPLAHRSSDRHDFAGLSYALARIVEHVTPNSRENSPMVLDHKVSLSILQAELVKQVSTVQTQRVSFKRLFRTSTQDAMTTLWRVSRQRMRPSEIIENTSPFEIESNGMSGSSARTKWLLWDRRFWIELAHEDPEVLSAVKIQPYCKSNASVLKGKLLEAGQFEAFEELLKSSAPDQMRYSLPMLIRNGQILAFPTLNFRVGGHQGLQWNVRTKKSCLSSRSWAHESPVTSADHAGNDLLAAS